VACGNNFLHEAQIELPGVEPPCIRGGSGFLSQRGGGERGGVQVARLARAAGRREEMEDVSLHPHPQEHFMAATLAMIAATGNPAYRAAWAGVPG